MTDLPKPLVPPDVDLRSYDWFPLHHKRLTGSKFWAKASGDVCKASVDLWCEAHQNVPAGSLEDDDVLLAQACGFGRRDVDDWLVIKDKVMAAWVLCSDGRWYHPTLCEIVLEQWETKRTGREAARERKRKQRERQKAEKEGMGYQGYGHVTRDGPAETPSHAHERTGQDRTGEDEVATPPVGASAPTLPLVLNGDDRTSGEKLVDAWNAMVDRTNPYQPKGLKLGRVAKFAGKVKTYAEARIEEHGLEAMLELVDQVEVTRFLRGGENGSGRSWRADFEFMVTASKVTKMLNGSWPADMEPGQELNHGRTGTDGREDEHSSRVRRSHEASLAGLD